MFLFSLIKLSNIFCRSLVDRNRHVVGERSGKTVRDVDGWAAFPVSISKKDRPTLGGGHDISRSTLKHRYVFIDLSIGSWHIQIM
jgi:hypothetical protein